MAAFQKIVVVDDGARTADYRLSAELAELGFASVTTSVEATDHVLAAMPPSSTVLVQLPDGNQAGDRGEFLNLADRLRASGYSVVLVDRAARSSTGCAALLQGRIGAEVLNQPER